jgi:predicted transcriptional regulator
MANMTYSRRSLSVSKQNTGLNNMREFYIKGSGMEKHIREIVKGGISKAHTIDSLLILLMEQEIEIDKSFNHIAILNEETSVKSSIINKLNSTYVPVNQDDNEEKLKDAIDGIKCRDLKIFRHKLELERMEEDRNSWKSYSESLENGE